MAFIVHWNCCGQIRNLGDVKYILSQYSPLALCIGSGPQKHELSETIYGCQPSL